MFTMKKRAMGSEFSIRRSDEVRITIRKSDGKRVYYKKESDGLRLDHEKKSDWVRVHHEKKSDGVRVDQEK